MLESRIYKTVVYVDENSPGWKSLFSSLGIKKFS